MPVNCGNAVVQTVSLLPAHARPRPRVPAVGRCLVHVGCTARLRCTVSLGTGLSCLIDQCVAGQSPSRLGRDYLRGTALDSPIGHATGTARVSVDLLVEVIEPGAGLLHVRTGQSD